MKKFYIIISIVLVCISSLWLYLSFTTPLVSVVMPTYRRAHLLPRSIDSILSQTFTDFELIIINDGSDDNTDQVINSYKDKRIRYYKNPQNKGISYSRNKGFNLARGKYIMIMDDDDISLPNRIKVQTTFLEKNPNIDVLAGQIEGFPLVPKTHDLIATELIQHNVIGNANIMYKKDFALKHNITYNQSLQLSEDWNYWLDMLFNGAKFNAIDDVVIKRDVFSHKYHSGNFEDGNVTIRKKVGKFFSPQNIDAFYTATGCEKLKMIAPKKIFTDQFLKSLIAQNCN